MGKCKHHIIIIKYKVEQTREITVITIKNQELYSEKINEHKSYVWVSSQEILIEMNKSEAKFFKARNMEIKENIQSLNLKLGELNNNRDLRRKISTIRGKYI